MDACQTWKVAPFFSYALIARVRLKKVGSAPIYYSFVRISDRRRSFYMQGNTTYYLYVKGQKVEVSEEIYRAYVQPEWKKKKREYRRKVKSHVSSIEMLAENGFEIEDKSQDFVESIIADEEHTEELSKLQSAIAQLSNRDRQVIQMYFFEGKTQQEIADIFEVSQQAVQKRLDRVLERIKNFF